MNTLLLRTARLFRTASVLIALMISSSALADGTRDWYPTNDGYTGDYQYRACLISAFNSSLDVNTGYSFPTPGTIKVYAKEGEYIYIASSEIRGNNGDNYGRFVWRAPNGDTGVYPTSRPGADNTDRVGYIRTREQELAGPKLTTTGTGGYMPYVLGPVTAEQEGIWEIDLYAVYTNNTGQTFNYSTTGEGNRKVSEWTFTNDHYVRAFDVSVANHAKTEFIKGRVYTNVLNTIIAKNAKLKMKLYVLTQTGYLYEVIPDGQNGHFSTFMANNKGIQTGEEATQIYKVNARTPNAETPKGGYPTYKSQKIESKSNTGNDVNVFKNNKIPIYDPRSPDNITTVLNLDGEVENIYEDVTHKIFFCKPAADLPETAKCVYASTITDTWLQTHINSNSSPTLSNVSMVGKESRRDKVFGPAGVDIYFDANMQGSFTIEIKFPAGSGYTDRTIDGICYKGANVIDWDGRDGNGKLFVNDCTIDLGSELQAAEIHFPYIDLEYNPTGVELNLFKAGSTTAYQQHTIYWNDTDISSTPTSGNTKVDGTSGMDGPAHAWTNTRGDLAMIDTWTYAKGKSPGAATVQCVKQWLDLEVTNVTVDNPTKKYYVGDEITYTISLRNNNKNTTYQGESVTTNADADSSAVGIWNIAGGFHNTKIQLVSTDDSNFKILAQPNGDENSVGFIRLHNGKTATVKVTGYATAALAHTLLQPYGHIVRSGDMFEIDSYNEANGVMPENPWTEYDKNQDGSHANNNIMQAPAVFLYNSLPSLTDDSYMAGRGSALSDNVLDNDIDNDEDPIVVTKFEFNGVESPAGTPVDVDGMGTLVVNANGTFNFVPNQNFTSQFVATYTVSDQYSGANSVAAGISDDVAPGVSTANLAIKYGTNNMPYIQPTSATIQSRKGNILVPINIVDPDDDEMTISLLGGDASKFTVIDGRIYYKGGPKSQDMVYNIQVAANDGVITTTKNVEITVKKNNAPVIDKSEVTVEVKVNETQPVIVPVTIHDIDGDVVNSNVSITGSKFFVYKKGVLSFVPNGTNVNTIGSTVYNLKLIVTDDQGMKAQRTLKVTIVVTGTPPPTVVNQSTVRGGTYGRKLCDENSTLTDAEYFQQYVVRPKVNQAGCTGQYKIVAQHTGDMDYNIDPTQVLPVGKYIFTIIFIPDQESSDFYGLTNNLVISRDEIEITTKDVTVTSGSTTREYNGEPLHNTTLAQEGFIGSDGVIGKSFASQTAVGSTQNSFTYQAKGITNLSNYNIVPFYGTLRVTYKVLDPQYEKIVLDPSEFIYSGVAQYTSIDAAVKLYYTEDGEDRLIEKSEYTIDWMDAVPKDVGHYTAKIKNVEGGSCTVAEKEFTFDIVPRPVVVEWPTDPIIYNGSNQTITATLKVNAVDAIHPDDATNVAISTYTGNVGKNAQTYTATVTGLSGSRASQYTLVDATGVTYDWEISPKQVTLTWPTQKQYPYTSQTITYPDPTIGGLCGSDVCEITGRSGNTGKEVKLYTSVVTSLSNSNYTLPSANSDLWQIVTNNTSPTVVWPSYNFTYDGTEHVLKPTSVKMGDVTLQEGVDYTVVCSNNVHPSVETKAEIFPGVGFNFPSITESYTIEPLELDIDWGTTTFTYNGDEKTVEATFTNLVGSDKLMVLAYDEDLSLNITNTAEDVGTYTASILALFGGYDDGFGGIDWDEDVENSYVLPADPSTIWKIVAEKVTPTVSGIYEKTYNGSAQTQSALVVKVGDTPLTLNTDYEVEYSNNTNAGTASMVIKSIGGNYSFDDISRTFIIKPKEVTGFSWPTPRTFTFDGAAKTYLTKTDNLYKGITLSGVLTGDQCYVATISGTNSATNANTYTITAQTLSNDNYVIKSGISSQSTTWEIEPNTTEPTIENIPSETYNKAPHTPEPVVKVGSTTLVKGTDYDIVRYEDNINAGTAKVVIQVKGNYGFAAEVSKSFSINKKVVTLTWPTPDEFIYDGTEKTYPAPTVNGIEEGDVCTATIRTGDKGTDADSYIAKVYAVDLSNYANYTFNSSPLQHTWKIKPIQLSISWPSTLTFTYDGTEKDVTPTLVGVLGVDQSVVKIATATDVKGTNVAKYTASVTVSVNDNYKAPTSGLSKEWKITGSTTVNIEDIPSVDYNGSAQTPALTVTGVGGTPLTENVDYEIVSWTNNINAGTTAKVTIKGKGNYSFGNTSKNFTITKKTLTLEWPTTNTFVYDGTQKSYTPTIAAGSLCGSDVCTLTVTGNTGTEVGNYTSKVTALAGADRGNYQLPSTVSQSWAISASHDAPVITMPSATYIYKGSAWTPEPTVTVAGTTLTKDVDYTLSYSANVNASANAKITIKSKGSHYDFSDEVRTFTIEKKEVELEWADDPEYTYDGTEKTYPTPTVKASSLCTKSGVLDVCTVTLQTTTGLGSNKGTVPGAYTAKATSLSNDNYKLPSGVQHGWTIQKATLTLTWPYSSPITYDGNEHDVTPSLSGIVGSDEVTLTNLTNVKKTANGSYNASVTIGGTNKGYYNLPSNTSLSWQIVKNDHEPVVAWPVLSYTYDGNEKKPEPTSVKVDGRTLVSGTDYTVTWSSNKDAGENTAKATITAKGNYSFTAVVKQFSIAKKPITLPWSSENSFPYDGSLKTYPAPSLPSGAVIAADAANCTLSVTNNTGTNVNTYTASASLSGTRAKNYTLTNPTQGWSIVSNNAEPTVTVSGTFVYNSAPHQPMPTVKVGTKTLTYDVDYTLTWSNNTDAGTAVVTVKAKGGYSFADKSANFTIQKKDVTLTWPTTTSFVYNAAARTLATPTINGIETSDNGKVSVVLTNHSKTAVGNYTATAVLSGDRAGNYSLTGSTASQAWKITAKPLTLTWQTTLEFPYDGAQHEVTATLTGVETVDAASGCVVGFTNNKESAVGNYTAKASFSGTAVGNYQLPTNTSQAWKIVANTTAPTIVWGNLAFTYDKTAKKPTPTSIKVGGKDLTLGTDYELVYQTDVTNVGSKVVQVKAKGGYSFTTVNQSYTISPKTITPKVNSVTKPKVYDGNATATANISIEGVVSGDNVNFTYSASYDNKNVGTSKSITAIYAINNANYQLSETEKVIATDGAITAKQLTATSVVTTSKVYDGSATAQVTDVVLSGVVSPDVVTATAVASYNDAKVGSNKPITVTYSIGGADAGNYIKPVDKTVTGEITQPTGVFKTIYVNSVYTYGDVRVGEGALEATLKDGLGGFMDGTIKYYLDGTEVAKSSLINAKYTGENNYVAYSYDAVYSNADGVSVRLSDQQSVTFKVTKRQLTVTGTVAANKTYDGNNTATLTTIGTLSNVVPGTDVEIDSYTAQFETVSSGENKKVFVSFDLKGADAGNYYIEVIQLTANIDPQDSEFKIEPTSGTYGVKVGVDIAKAVNVLQDGGSATYTYFNAEGNVDITDAVLAPGTYTIYVKYHEEGHEDATSSNKTITILPKQLTPVINLTKDKKYDGNNTATVTVTSFSGKVKSTDDVSVVATATYNDEKVGSGKSITVVYNLEGANADRYTIVPSQTFTGSITQPTVTWTDNLPADNTYGVPVVGTTVTLAIEEDLGTGTYSYKVDGANVTTPYRLPVGTHSIVVTFKNSNGVDLSHTISNYEVVKKQLTVTGTTIAEKPYDGNTKANIATYGTLVGVLTGDVVDINTASTTAVYTDDANAGVNKPVKVTYALTGADASNYSVAPTNASGNINKISPVKADYTVTKPTDLVYNGHKKEVTVTGPGTIMVKYSNDGGATWTAEPINVATYSVKLIIAEGTNTTEAEFTDPAWAYTIVNAEQAAPNVTGYPTSVAGASDGHIRTMTTAMEYKLKGAADYITVTNPEVGLPAGTYVVRYAAKPNYNASPDKEVVIGEGKGFRNPNDYSVACADAKYDGNAHPATASGPGSIKVYYSNDNGTSWTTTAPVEVDHYIVKLIVEQDDDFFETEIPNKPEWKYEITKGDQDAPSVSGKPTSDVNHDDGQIVGLTDKMEYRLDSETLYTAGSNSVILLPAGTYKVRYTENEHYLASPDATVIIGQGKGYRDKADYSVVCTDAKYDGNLHPATASGPGSITIEYSDNNGSTWDAEPREVAQYIVRLVIAETADYLETIIDNDLQWKYQITKGDRNAPDVEGVATSAAGVNDGKILRLTTDMEYRLKGATDYNAVGSPDMLFAAQTYEVRYKEDAHYNASPATEVVIGSGKAYRNEADYSVECADAKYDGNAHPATAHGDGDIKVWYTTDGSTWTTEEPVEVAKYTVKLTVAEDGNYFAAEIKNPAWTYSIVKGDQAAPVVSGTPTSTASAADGHIVGLTTDMEYRVKDAAEYIAVTDPNVGLPVGTYEVRYKENEHYLASPAAEAVIDFGKGVRNADDYTVDCADVKYDGNTHPAVAHGEGQITVFYSADAGATWTTNEPVEVAQYTVKLAVAEDENFLPFEVTKAAWKYSILKGDQDAPVVSGKATTAVDKADGQIIGLKTDMEYRANGTQTYTKVTDTNVLLAAGTYYVRYAENTRYNASPDAEVVINSGKGYRADNYDIIKPDDLYYNGKPKPATPVGDGDITVTYSNDGGQTWTEDAPVNLGEYKVKLTIAEDDNYFAAEFTKDAWSYEIIKRTRVIDDYLVSMPIAPVYDGKQKPATAEGDGQITILYSADKGKTWTEEAPREVGQYTVKLEIAEDDFYYGAEFTNKDWVFAIVPFEGVQEIDMADEFTVAEDGYCPNTTGTIGFHIVTGKPTQYRMVIEGIDTISIDQAQYKNLGNKVTVSFKTLNAEAGLHKVSMQFKNANGDYTPIYQFNVMINLTERYMTDIWTDVISIINKVNLNEPKNLQKRFMAYQWVRDDEEILGATKAFYCQQGGLQGTYYVKVVTLDGDSLRTCPHYYDNVDKNVSVTVYPNPVVSSAQVRLSYDTGDEHELVVRNYNGVVMETKKFNGKATDINLSGMTVGYYVVSVDGKQVKVIKK